MRGSGNRQSGARLFSKPAIAAVGRAKWQRESGYHRRSLAETAVFRLKMTVGLRQVAPETVEVLELTPDGSRFGVVFNDTQMTVSRAFPGLTVPVTEVFAP